MKYFAIGDVHGCSAQLEVLLQHPEFYEGHRVIFLGDYVDIGPNSKGVIEQLLAFRVRHPESVFLKGNHDLALQSYLQTGDFVGYAQVGGIETIRAYCGEVRGDVQMTFDKAVPTTHKDFLANLETYFETEEYLFSHCGYDPETPLDRSVDSMVLQSHQKLFTDTPLPKVAVCGHYFQRAHRAILKDSVICLDTGCGVLGGPLTAATLPDRRIFQVSDRLELQLS